MSAKIKKVEDAIEIFFKLKKRILHHLDSDPFVEYLEGDGYIFGLWFRGELDFKLQGLTPSIFRKNRGFLNESAINNHLPAINENVRNLKNTFDRLCMMQHYDIPSRLLDWSESILTALYFAVNKINYNKNGKISHSDIDGKLFCLNAIKLNDLFSLRLPKQNIHQPEDFGTLFRTNMVNSNTKDEWNAKADNFVPKFNWLHKKLNTRYIEHLGLTQESVDKNLDQKIQVLVTPIATMPNRITNRLILQSGMFTLHGGKLYNTDDYGKKEKILRPKRLLVLNDEFSLKGETFLEEYTIPKIYKEKIKGQLMNLGIHQGTLFPELDKQAEFCLILK